MENDFNGDGVRDLASADPEAAAAGVSAAGTVTVLYGATGAVQVIHQDTAGVPDANEAGERFGLSLTSYDANSDGCSDLLVGAPYEDIGTQVDAGAVCLLYGSPAGLLTGATAAISYDQSSSAVPGEAEAGDWFGYSLAASKTPANVPFLLVGAPGEDLGTTADAGTVDLLHAGTWAGFDQGSAGYPDTDTSDSVVTTYEANDRFGYAVAATPYHIAVGAPGETALGSAFTGEVAVYSTTLTTATTPIPTLLRAATQDGPLSGAAEANDLFAASLSMAAYHPSGAMLLPRSLIAVGIPGEDLTVDGVDHDSAGRVMVLQANESGTVVEFGEYSQSVANVDDDIASGDHFGQQVLVVNRTPNGYATSDTMLLMVGVPGKDAPGKADTGYVHSFSLLGAAGDADRILRPGTAGLPGAEAAQDFRGLSFAASADHLYLATPYAENQAVHRVPWANVLSSGTSAVTTYQAGSTSIPAGASFGAAVS
ncbi:hypothetical protein SAMN04489716_9318 [Actinoplanes derwentensis]|uniref:FG-GAP repeat-containing protein n=2 Tax=Actinoplanes derwentensis TaxID=113562 RepID=A0A1H2DDM4_9ACTN|nr:hypothetical protein Ade03nite_85710 [Actinoplanes derwentensis]SDT80697.1 hypothetical protein SAMN04489716_9318 [Actinoplanes derwentensis]